MRLAGHLAAANVLFVVNECCDARTVRTHRILIATNHSTRHPSYGTYDSELGRQHDTVVLCRHAVARATTVIRIRNKSFDTKSPEHLYTLSHIYNSILLAVPSFGSFGGSLFSYGSDCP